MAQGKGKEGFFDILCKIVHEGILEQRHEGSEQVSHAKI